MFLEKIPVRTDLIEASIDRLLEAQDFGLQPQLDQAGRMTADGWLRSMECGICSGTACTRVRGCSLVHDRKLRTKGFSTLVAQSVFESFMMTAYIADCNPHIIAVYVVL